MPSILNLYTIAGIGIKTGLLYRSHTCLLSCLLTKMSNTNKTNDVNTFT